MGSMARGAAQPAGGSPADDAVVELRGVSKTFRQGREVTRALAHIDLAVPRGQITCLVGPDGAGKTTLLRIAAALLLPDSGTVSALGLDVVRQPQAVQSAIGYMPQRFGLYEDLSVQENLNLYADLHGVRGKVREERLGGLLPMTGLAPFTDRLAGRLSGGMKQKLGLACTLIREPRLLLLDEPTVGVDPVSRRELWAIVERRVKEQGTTVLMSTAYLDEAERCTDVVLLDGGELVESGPPRQFTAAVEGQTFLVTVPAHVRRQVQSQLTEAPGVIDAAIQPQGVRLVVERQKANDRDLQALIGDIADASIAPIAPRLEDAIMALFRARRNAEAETRSGEQPAPAPSQLEITSKHYVTDSGTTGPMIEVREVTKRFGMFTAVEHVTFDVKPGEVFGLLGANGAGKSTTFRMLCGLLPPSGGSLRVAGVDVRRAAADARARLGYMSQKFSLYGDLSIFENLRFFSSAYGVNGQRRTERIDWALDQFHLRSHRDSQSASLSLGYKQRLALACALLHEPEVLFLDEPTSGVDPLARREFWARINALAAAGVTVLVTTHFMEEAEYCDRLAIMAAGKILELGTPGEIREHARSEELPEPTIEDAFIHLIESQQPAAKAAS